MPSIDRRVVEMQFNNAQFERGIKTSTDSLGRLKESLNFDKQSAALKQFENYSNNVNFSGLQNGIEAIKNRFSALGIAGAEVIRTLTNEAMYLGSRIVSSVAAPLSNVAYLMKEGGKQRALNVEQAKFIMEGLKMDFASFDKDINEAVSGTRFGYDEAAMAASQLAASGVNASKKLNKSGKEITRMGEALLAISGAAAMTNSEYSDMANIFTTVASNGRLMTEQVRSFSYRGLNITADLAKYFKKTEAQMADMISKGKIDFKEFSEAMYELYGKQATKADEMLTGVTANIRAAWKKIGQDFWTPIVANNGPIVKGLQKFKDLVNNTIRPAVRSLFAIDGKEFTEDNTWMRTVKNVGKAMQKVFSSAYTVQLVERSIKSIGGSVKTVIDGVNTLIKSSHTANIIKNTIDGIGQSIEAVKSFIKPFKDILKNFIPKVTLENLDALSEKLYNFSTYLQALTGVKFGSGKIIPDIASDIDESSDSFKLFQRLWGALLKIFENGLKAVSAGFTIFKDAVKAFFKIFEPIAEPLVGVIEHFATFTDEIAKFVKKMWALESASHIFEKTFQGLADFVAPALSFIIDNVNVLLDALGKLAHWGGGKIAEFIRIFNEAFFTAPQEASLDMSPLQGFIDWILGGLGAIRDGFAFIMAELAPTIERVKVRIIKALSRISAAFQLDTLKSSLKAGGIMGLIMIFQQLFAKYKWKIMNALKNIGDPIQRVSKLITNAISNFSSMMSNQVKSIKVERVKTLAEAILILAGAMFVLSLIPADQLAVSVAAVGSALMELGVMMKFLEKLGTSGDDRFGEFKFAAKATGFAIELIGLSAALLILAFAMKKMADLDPEGLARSIFAIGTLLVALGAFVKLAQIDDKAKLPTMSLILLAVAVRIMAGALGSLAKLDGEALARGILGIYSLMFAMGLFTKYASNEKGFTKTTFALILLSVAVRILTSAVNSMAKLDNEGLARGVFGLYNIMLAMGLFTNFAKNEKGFMKTVSSLVILGIAVKLMVSAVRSMAELNNEALARGILGIYALFGAFILITRYTKHTKGLIGAAAAMVILSMAMTTFANVIGTLGNMDPEKLALGLFALGVALLEIGIAMHYLSKDKGLKLGTMAGMLMMAVMINMLVGALQKMSAINPEGMALALLALGVALAEIVIAMNALGGGNGLFTGISMLFKGAGFLLMGAGINILADALIKLSNIEPEKMALALFGLCASLIAMAAASMVASGPMLALGTAVALFGAGVGALGWGIAKLGVALVPIVAMIVAAGPEIIQFLKDLVIGFAEVLPVLVRGLVNAVAEFFVALVDKADELADSVGQLILTILIKLKEIIPQIIEVLAEILAEIWKYLGPALEKLFPWLLEKLSMGWEWIKANFFPLLGAGLDWIWGLVMGVLGWILQGVINFVSAVNGFFSGLVDFIWGIIQDIWNAGVEFVTNLIGGVQEKLTDATEAVGQLVQSMVDKVTGFWQSFHDAGANLIQGIIDGVGSLWNDAVGALGRLGSSMWRKFTSFWQEKSPSRRAKWGAEMIVRGLVKGISDYGYLASREVSNMSEDMWNSLDFVGSAVADALNSDVNPTITPVLDLSKIQNGTNAINGMLGGVNSLFGTTSFALASANGARFEASRLAALDKLETASTNADVVAALGLLRGDVNNLNESFANTKVVLDSGALVGATVKKMDNALGRINVYKGRGI